MKAAVLSDLHLLQRSSPRNEAFVALLRDLEAQPEIAEIWLLGDIYDLFIGPFPFWRRTHAEVFASLERLARAGRRILWIEGNHDFHLAKLLTPLGVECIDGNVTRDFGGRRVFLAHGDRVNLDDRPYLRWRAFTRSWLFRFALKVIPDFLAERFLVPLGERLSHDSRLRDRYDPSLREMYRAYARGKFTEGFDAVCLGHCHILENLEEGGRVYFNSGSWIEKPYRYGLFDPVKNSVEVQLA